MLAQEIELDERAAEIRDRMQRLRQRMDCEVDTVRQQTERLLDWRVQVRKHPWAAAGLAAAVGYFIVPGRRVTPAVKLNDSSIQDIVAAARELRDTTPDKTEKTVLQGAVAAIGGLLLRQLISAGSARLGQYIREHGQRRPGNGRPVAAPYAPSQTFEGDR